MTGKPYFVACLVVACALLATVSARVSAFQALQVSGAERMPSNCLAIAQNLPGARYVNFASANTAPKQGEVRIEFVGHSTFWITSPGGVTIATDYAGWTGRRGAPVIATMNKAHETHYTDAPDPAIKHVLRGWNPAGGPASHNLEVGDVLVRNVTTDIRSWGTREKDGNSIFIFEVSGLCIGHVGHLHHELGAGHVGWIGRLDVVMVPVDGSMTLPIENMIEVVKLLKARIVLPMHAFGDFSMSHFVAGLGKQFDVRPGLEKSITVSQNTLPPKPTVFVLQPTPGSSQ